MRDEHDRTAARSGGRVRGRRASAAIGLLLAAALPACRPAKPAEGWLDRLFEEGRTVFHQTVRDALTAHPDRGKLTETETSKILSAESLYPRLYGLLVNTYYQTDEPAFRGLLEEGSRGSAERFAAMYLDVARRAARQFLECFFLTDWTTEHARTTFPKYKGLDAVDLVVRSIGYDARLDEPEVPAALPPLDDRFREQGALDGGRFREAHGLSRGAGVKIAILDTGVDPSHPVFARTRFGRHFSLVGRDGPPWASDVPVVDWGWHGTIVSSIAAVYAPEAELTVYKFGDGDLQNDPAYQLLMQDMIAACIYRAVHDGCHVISISASGASIDADDLRAAVRYAEARNRVVISGNLYSRWQKQGAVLNFPGQYETVVSVTAARPRKGGGYEYWDVCAPGETTGVAAPNDIFGAFPTYVEEKDAYVPSISAAIPTVAALCALAISVYPPLGTEPPGAYAGTIRRLVTENANPRAVGFDGFTPECGHGLIDAAATVKAALELVAEREAATRR